MKVKGKREEVRGLKRVVLNRNGQITAKAREVSDLKIGMFTVGQHVMLGIKGACLYKKPTIFAEYVVTSVERVNRYEGRDRVTFERVDKRPAKEGGAK